MTALRLLAASIVVVMAACGDGAGSSSGSTRSSAAAPASLEEAASRLRELVDATVAEIAPDAPTEMADGSGRQLCSSESDDEREDYSLFVDVSTAEIDVVIERARRYWEGQGYEVLAGDGVTAPHDAEVSLEGYGARIGATPDDRVSVAGSTDCFPAG